MLPERNGECKIIFGQCCCIVYNSSWKGKFSWLGECVWGECRKEYAHGLFIFSIPVGLCTRGIARDSFQAFWRFKHISSDGSKPKGKCRRVCYNKNICLPYGLNSSHQVSLTWFDFNIYNICTVEFRFL